MSKKLYLKPNVLIEPLINSWYAWSHLISPVTASMNIRNRHIPIMKSYVAHPQAHAAAVKNPQMLGGPFIDYNGERVDDIRNLLEKMVNDQADLLTLASDIETLNAMLKENARGYSLIPLYEKIPESLKGYVELVYDINHFPSFRLKESLLYKSRFYKPEMQSLSLFQVNADDERPFVFSTPRLPDPARIQLPISFADPRIDELFKMKRNPQPYEFIRDLLNIGAQDEKLFRDFFCEETKTYYTRYNGDYIRTRYFGHACLLIETKEISLLIDPIISYDYEVDYARLSYKDLPDTIDYVLITHNHQDHILFETILQLRHKIRNIIVPRSSGGILQDPGLKLMLTNIGFKNVFELEELEELEIPGGRVIGLPFYGEHCDLDIKSKLGFLIHINDYKVLCLADSNNIEPRVYEHVHKIYGDADVLFLGMECLGAPLSWLYGPYMGNKTDKSIDQSRRLAGCDYNGAINIVNRFNCKEVYVYAMGLEPWLKYITSIVYTDESDPIVQSNKLIESCRKAGRISERLFGEKELLASRVSSANTVLT